MNRNNAPRKTIEKSHFVESTGEDLLCAEATLELSRIRHIRHMYHQYAPYPRPVALNLPISYCLVSRHFKGDIMTPAARSKLGCQYLGMDTRGMGLALPTPKSKTPNKITILEMGC